MKKLMLGLLALGFTTQLMFSQEIELAEVSLDVNSKYLNAIASEDLDINVKNLEKETAFYKLAESGLNMEEYDSFKVVFEIPEGKIIARYNKECEILNTFEKFKNVQLPRTVLISVSEQYPNWRIVDSFYKVYYNGETGNAKKQYKVKVENGTKSKQVKLNGSGLLL